MKWYSGLYVGESFLGQEKKIKKKIEHLDILPYAWVLTLPANPANLIDMIPARELVQKAYPKDRIRIIGIAANKSEGLDLIRQIIEETWTHTGTVRVEDYLKMKGESPG